MSEQSFVTRRLVAATLLVAAVWIAADPMSPSTQPALFAGGVAGAISSTFIILSVAKAMWLGFRHLAGRVRGDEEAAALEP